MKEKTNFKRHETILDIVLLEFYKKENTIAEISQKMGVPESTISRILNWTYRNPHQKPKFIILQSKLNNPDFVL